jgi:hypothetical protein
MATRWILNADQLGRLFDNSPVKSIPGFEFRADGQGLVEFLPNGTYTYKPNFTLLLKVSDQGGTGEFAGDVAGTWSVSGDTLTMTQTTYNVTGSLNILGVTRPMPRLETFNGTATNVVCDVATLKYQLNPPTGPLNYTLVLAP